MKKIHRLKVLSIFLIGAYLLAACGGALPESGASTQGPKVQASVVAFTGIVEAINGNEWTVSGQKLTIDPQAALDPNIVVGDEVKVEANVFTDGAVVVMKIETSKPDDVVPTVSAQATGTPATSGPQATGANAREVFGAVEAMTASTIVVNGVTYNLLSSTEFKDVIGVGDQVKLHVIVNADGTLAIREIEKSTGGGDDNSNSSNSNGSIGNSNDSNSNDDNSNDDNGNDNNSNDDNGSNSNDDSGGNGNGNRGGNDNGGGGNGNGDNDND